MNIASVDCAAANSDLITEKSLFAVAVRNSTRRTDALMAAKAASSAETKDEKSSKSKNAKSGKGSKGSKTFKGSKGWKSDKKSKSSMSFFELHEIFQSGESDTVLIFDPERSVPVVSIKLSTKILAMTWARESVAEGRRMCLYCLTERGEVVKIVEGAVEKVPIQSQEVKKASAFDEVFEVDKVEELANEMNVKDGYSRNGEKL